MFQQEMTDSMIHKLSSSCVLVAKNKTIHVLEALKLFMAEFENVTMKNFLI